jgi:hypothetical protein
MLNHSKDCDAMDKVVLQELKIEINFKLHLLLTRLSEFVEQK